jgi:hypothetical protein
MKGRVPVKSIRLSGHARERIDSRGATLEEVADTIRTAPRIPADGGRLECQKDFSYGREWNGKVYGTKRVRPIFADETNEILVVTVYVYYF